MKLAYRFSAVLIIVAVSASVALGAAAKAPPLPEWAPKHPSKEFLRVAKVLKPLPDELLRGVLGNSAEGVALLQRYHRTMPAAYEFFGTMSDQQIKRFRITKEIRIPPRSLTARQRAALNHWFDSWSAAMKGMRPELEDFLVSIYKIGGKEDLSNVDVGFTGVRQEGRKLVPGHLVQVYFWVKRPGGKVIDWGTTFAQL